MNNNTIQIALADDHIILRKGLAELINDFEGMKIIIDVSNGEELISRMKTATPLPDVCILDINMPVMNGYDTARALKAQWPEVKILALSMYDNEFNIIRMLRSGAGGYVLKDAEPAELCKAIREIEAHDFYHSDLVTGRMFRKLMQPVGNEDEELSEKEIHFLGLCCSELTYKEIAEKMFLSPRTIDGYRDGLFQKLKIKSRTGLVMYALRAGISPL